MFRPGFDTLRRAGADSFIAGRSVAAVDNRQPVLPYADGRFRYCGNNFQISETHFTVGHSLSAVLFSYHRPSDICFRSVDISRRLYGGAARTPGPPCFHFLKKNATTYDLIRTDRDSIRHILHNFTAVRTVIVAPSGLFCSGTITYCKIVYMHLK